MSDTRWSDNFFKMYFAKLHDLKYTYTIFKVINNLDPTRDGIESNEFRIDFYRIFRIIFHLRINQIINFRIESNEFRMNPASENFDFTLKLESNQI